MALRWKMGKQGSGTESRLRLMHKERQFSEQKMTDKEDLVIL